MLKVCEPQTPAAAWVKYAVIVIELLFCFIHAVVVLLSLLISCVLTLRAHIFM